MTHAVGRCALANTLLADAVFDCANDVPSHAAHLRMIVFVYDDASSQAAGAAPPRRYKTINSRTRRCHLVQQTRKSNILALKSHTRLTNVESTKITT